MVTPGNILTSCPAGHQVQVAQTDLGKLLACPTCGTTFVVGDAQGAAVSLRYADGTMRAPVRRPAYMPYMLTLWIISTGVTAVMSPFATNGMKSFASSGFPGMSTPTGSMPAVQAFGQRPTVQPVVCLSLCAAIFVYPAMVLQLMWIYRIHKDALTARAYTDISPGLALGLSFIPAFQYPWTAWTLRKLSLFAAQADAPLDAVTQKALTASKICFVAGIVYGAANLIALPVGLIAGYKGFFAGLSGATVNPFAGLESIMLPWTIVSSIITLIALFTYVRAVVAVQRSLYRHLGAV